MIINRLGRGDGRWRVPKLENFFAGPQDWPSAGEKLPVTAMVAATSMELVVRGDFRPVRRFLAAAIKGGPKSW